MGLPWIRLDTSITDHPKILQLIADKNHKSALVYLFSLAYAGRHETDGWIPATALPFLHATTTDARNLCSAQLWIAGTGGWEINGWRDFQVTSDEHKARKERAKANAIKRWKSTEEVN